MSKGFQTAGRSSKASAIVIGLLTASCSIGGLVLASCSEESKPGAGTSSSGSTASSGSTSSNSGSSTSSSGGSSGGSSSGTSGEDAGTDSGNGSFVLTSTAYSAGAMIPTKHECSSNGPGDNVSPALAWSGEPVDTESYAIVMRDLDFISDGAPFIHWVIWDIPKTEHSLAENVEHTFQPTSPAGAKQAKFSGSIVGYQGPCSPGKVNTYEITIYAIPTSSVPGLTADTPKTDAAAAIVNAAKASAKLAGES